MTRIFISYSRVDRRFVEGLTDKLRRIYTHDNVWFDEGLHGGDIWWEEILDQIAEREIFIYVLSNESVQSEYCQAEFEEARRLQKQIVTVQARDRTQLTENLSDIHYVNMAGGSDDGDALADLIRAINKRMKNVPKRQSKPLWEPRTSKPQQESEVPRQDTAPEVDTPLLEIPSIERESMLGAANKVWWRSPRVFIGVVLFLVAAGTIGGLVQNPSFLTDLLSQPGQEESLQAETPADVVDLTATHETSETLAVTQVPTQDATFTATRVLPTKTSVPTGVSTLSLLEDALQRAGVFSGGNGDWKPHVELIDGVEMVLVPVGSFELGREGTGVFADEMPARNYHVESPFWIDRTEVTWEMYRMCLEVPDSPCADGPVRRAPGFATVDDMPVVEIAWQEALEYCHWRGGALPTEVQWEYAASGPDNLLYPWGNELDTAYAVMRADDGVPAGRPESVGSRSEDESWVGAMDMAGNVAEWTLTPYLQYDDPDYADALADESYVVDERVTRGGAYSYAGNVHTSYRHELRPNNHLTDFGFRCVVEIEE